ncbi:MerR family transcriptional regulator [Exiguobacterium sp. Helios]|uniref:Transcriptional regulator, MerR family n=1 Tax=Exiguobacterium sibiricum (strain DSM 17290 / CCUG 55495 / CIP 109462 / JCM 13490 / 255-15) TaxID=262543 RepID=B1YHX4_EXIS2|nr:MULTISPECIES: MerR family transcriptional regulator [Exiguobacterium]ACB59758.1 transcriptional regulator, MerR family [Exiguobacterium sibiricum 255-15]MCK2158310.1 MerR family transcriptional regulator [Exiguobacterium sp. 17-1]MDW2884586.1 MerR family transcriptional regulator [Exiguobacterium sibiricum]QNR19922.1 MerR family transcriptional regulator [Exiguobacterium sp. Helios]
MRIFGKALLKIGQVAEATGLSKRTIDYYTSLGLLTTERTPAGYRLYTEDVVQHIQKIEYLKTQRLSLQEILAFFTEREVKTGDAIYQEVQQLQESVNGLEQRLLQSTDYEKQEIRLELSQRLTLIASLIAQL